MPTLELIPHTPVFFAQNALEFDFSASAPAAERWLGFLAKLWSDDPESIATLQEIFGLALTGDTRHQKAFLLIGPKRSGKGTIARILVALVGRANAVSPTLASLGERFGLAPLIGKLLAVISDARLGAKADQHAIAESMLRISGEDDITADRKNRDTWTGRMRVRFLVISNELPRLADASSALASRFIILRLVESFYGREDQGLTARLETELPSILNWALAGLQPRAGLFRPAHLGGGSRPRARRPWLAHRGFYPRALRSRTRPSSRVWATLRSLVRMVQNPRPRLPRQSSRRSPAICAPLCRG